MKKSPITAFVIALLVIVACAQKETVRENAGGSFPAQAPEEEFVKDDAVQGLNAFTFELYRLIAEATEGNTFYSPLSISAALAITYAGAGTETAREMRKVMHFGPQNEAFHTKYGGMLDGLRSGDDADFEMKIANAAWVQKQYTLRNAYLHTIGNAYRSTARELDFREKPQASSDTINQWVSDQTAGRIRDLVPASAITARTRLILTNAVYFNAKWSNPFNEDMTKKAPFYLSDGLETETELMYQRHYYAYSETEDHQVLDLEYKGGEYVMTVILPRETGGIGELSGTPGAELLARHDTLKQRKDVLVYLPKFRMETKYELSPFLSGLGIKTAFTPAADFSGMTGGKDLMISAVLHKAFIEVDEKKTEAAAATSVVMRLTAMPPAPEAPVEFRADHPFMFVIRHRDDKAVLFIGHLIEPEAS